MTGTIRLFSLVWGIRFCCPLHTCPCLVAASYSSDGLGLLPFLSVWVPWPTVCTCLPSIVSTLFFMFHCCGCMMGLGSTAWSSPLPLFCILSLLSMRLTLSSATGMLGVAVPCSS